jgi:hypothetical protein
LHLLDKPLLQCQRGLEGKSTGKERFHRRRGKEGEGNLVV